MRFRVLGPLEVWDGSRRVPVGGPQQRALLAVLLLNANRVVPVEQLVAYLWGERPPATARGLLQGCVAQLRRALPAGAASQPLVTRPPGYLLRVEPGELDLDRFEELVAAAEKTATAGRAEALGAASALLAEALALWHGPALGGVPPATREARAASLEERRLGVLERRIDLDLRLGRQADLVGELRTLVREHPLRERPWAQLMVALAGTDRQAEALAAYRELRAILVDELGIEPATTLQQLERTVLAGENALATYLGEAPPAAVTPTSPGPVVPAPRGSVAPAQPGPVVVAPRGSVAPAPPASVAAAPPAPVPAQLPAAVTAFTGRDEQLARLDGLIGADPSRLVAGEPGMLVGGGPGAVVGGEDGAAVAVPVVVVSGTAGVGKTALAVHWGQRVRGRFPDGQLYVDLRGYASAPPLRPVDALAGFLPALGVPAERVPADPEQAAALYRTLLADRRVLVVLDNARDVEQVRPLLPGSPGCLVLVTSRDTLTGLVARDGAHPIGLDVLAAGEARALLDRLLGPARTAAEPAATADLADRCGRLPLALRIAAAHLLAHPARTIADQVKALSGGDRLAALAVPGDEATAVRAAFALSYAALDPAARRLFRLLGLVPGPDVTPPAATALAGADGSVPGSGATVPAALAGADVAGLLERLAEAHLLARSGGDRYAFHDLLRLYAIERAGAEETAEERAAALARLDGWYLATADAAARRLYPDKPRLPLPPLPAVAGFADRAAAVRWLDAERPNLVAAVRQAAQRGPRPVAWLLADALRGYLWLRMDTVDWLVLAEAALAAATAAGDGSGRAAAHLSLADVHRCQGRYDRAIEHYSRAAELCERAGWSAGQAAVLGNLGNAYFWLGRLDEAAGHYRRALALARRDGLLPSQAVRLGNLGLVYWLLGRLRDAADQHQQALDLHRRLNDHANEAVDLANLGETWHGLGDLDRAVELATAALELHHEVGDQRTEAETLTVLAAAHRDAGRHRQALELARTAVALAQDAGDLPFEASARNTLGSVHSCRSDHQQALDEHRRGLALAEQTGTHHPRMVALVGLAGAHLALGHSEEAEAHAHLALTLAGPGGFRVVEGQAHAALAAVRLARGEPDAAAEHARTAVDLHRRCGHRLGEARALVLLGRALGGDRAAWSRALDLLTSAGAAEADGVRALLADR
jgi:DNA-binding SARP family transcriptional activator/tetratricopeptide (TPR) repeat protein